MITEEVVMATLAKSNPVPDVEAIELVESGRSIYLATLESRSNEMTDVDVSPDRAIDHSEPAESEMNKRRSTAWWLIAAMAILLLGTIGFLISRDNPQAPVVEPATPVLNQTDPESTLEGYISAYNSGDLEGVMSYFSDESVLVNHPYDATGTSTGIEEIRRLQNIDMTAGAAQNAYEISNVEVAGDEVTWDHVWMNNRGQKFCKSGMSAVVEDGRFVTFTWPTTNFTCP